MCRLSRTPRVGAFLSRPRTWIAFSCPPLRVQVQAADRASHSTPVPRSAAVCCALCLPSAAETGAAAGDSCKTPKIRQSLISRRTGDAAKGAAREAAARRPRIPPGQPTRRQLRTSGVQAPSKSAASSGRVSPLLLTRMPAVICLDSSPPLLQSGCACRGDAGLAHVACRVKAAESQAPVKEGCVWWDCQTCKQAFTGAMQRGLAEACLSKVRGREQEEGEWQMAA